MKSTVAVPTKTGKMIMLKLIASYLIANCWGDTSLLKHFLHFLH